MSRRIFFSLSLAFISINPSFLSVSEAAEVELDPNSRVSLNSGSVVGFREGGVYKYLGIPYAVPPVGSRRFAPPEAIDSLPANFSADREVFCPQVENGQSIGTEDCLVVNVFAPINRTSRPRDVHVFIHGGSFTAGSGALGLYDGEYYARRGSILVTLNYRLGALGFLGLPERIAGADNLGVRDQQLALRWVRDNIASFGGNPHNVTLVGQSAGASGVLAQLTNEESRSLFHRAIIQSAPYNSVYSRDEAVAIASRVIENVGCSDSAEVVECLRGIPADVLAAAGQNSVVGVAGFSAWFDGEFIQQLPITAIAQGVAANIPLFIGSTFDEHSVFMPLLPVQVTDEATFGAVVGSLLDPTAVEPLGQLYFPAFNDWGRAFEALFSELSFACPVRAQLEAASTHGVAYGYRFARRPESGPRQPFGASHGLDLRYMFNSFAYDDYVPPSVDQALSNSMNFTWRNFARIYAGSYRSLTLVDTTGRPSRLRPYTSQSPQYVIYDSRVSTGTDAEVMGRCRALEQFGLVQTQ